MVSLISGLIPLASSHGQISQSIHILRYMRKSRIFVSGGDDQIKQILWNLLLNASQAVDESVGIIKISADECRDPGEAGMVRLIVADNGPGIPENLREKIFEPFFSTKADGTGLGLPIVARIVDCLGGRIDIDSAPDWPTRFVVYLPAAQEKIPDPVGLPETVSA